MLGIFHTWYREYCQYLMKQFLLSFCLTFFASIVDQRQTNEFNENPKIIGNLLEIWKSKSRIQEDLIIIHRYPVENFFHALDYACDACYYVNVSRPL